jgi:hypothetical protein
VVGEEPGWAAGEEEEDEKKNGEDDSVGEYWDWSYVRLDSGVWCFSRDIGAARRAGIFTL